MATDELTRVDPTAALATVRPSVAARVLIALVRLYQRTLSRVLGGRCRFTPSCSHYGLACLRFHGAVRGSYYTVRRLCRCHPFHPGGYDPPPPERRAPGSRTQ